MLFPKLAYKSLTASNETPISTQESALRLVDTIEIVAASPSTGQLLAPQTSLAFGSAGDGKAAYPLREDKRYLYYMCGPLFIVENNPTIEAIINGVQTNDDALCLLYGGASVSHGAQTDILLASGTMTQPITGKVEFEIYSLAGALKPFSGRGTVQKDGSVTTNDFRERVPSGVWQSTAALSSLGLISSVADALGAGTFMSLFEIDLETLS